MSVYVDVCVCRDSQLPVPAFTDRLLIECVDMHGFDAGKALDETRITALTREHWRVTNERPVYYLYTIYAHVYS